MYSLMLELCKVFRDGDNPMLQWVPIHVSLAHVRLDVSPQEGQEHDILDFASQHVPPFPVQVALPDPVAHQIPAPGQPAVDNLRRLAIRFLHHPDSQIDLISMEPGMVGLCRVVIILELADVL